MFRYILWKNEALRSRESSQNYLPKKMAKLASAQQEKLLRFGKIRWQYSKQLAGEAHIRSANGHLPERRGEAPGRRIHLSIESDEPLTFIWRLGWT